MTGGPKMTCVGHSTDGTFCRNWPINGGTVCYQRHGGRIFGNVQVAAREKIEAQRAERAVATYGLPIDIDPFDAIREEIARTHGHVKWLGAIVAEMEPVDLVWSRASEETTETTTTATSSMTGDTSSTSVRSEAGLAVWLTLYNREREHLVKICAVAIKCGIAQRELELLERYGDMMAKLLDDVFGDPELALDPATQDRCLAIASKHLRAA